MRFQFIHAADLHIDSPLAALGLKDPRVASVFAAAGRRAVEQLVAYTIESGAKFLIVAGDVFDGDWRDVSTGLFFVRELGKLDRAGVRTFVIRGNHDALSEIPRDLPYPGSVHVFEARESQTQLIEDLRVAVHGRSFPKRAVGADFLSGYAPRHKDWLNIGVLHTSLDGAYGHDLYAPCTVQDLARFNYDYWALGHVHTAAIVARDPWVVYPGNIQGRHARETGPKGAMQVTVDNGRVVAVEPVAFDGARWAHENIDLSGLHDDDAIAEAIASALAAAHARRENRMLALRLTLTGETQAHARLRARHATGQWLAEIQAIAEQFSDECWIEKVRLQTSAPQAPPLSETDALDVAALLNAAAQDPALLAEIEALKEGLKAKAPLGLPDLEELLTRSPADWASHARDLLLGTPA